MHKYLKPVLLAALILLVVTVSLFVDPKVLLDKAVWLSLVEELGIFAPLAFIATFAIVQPFVLPGFVFVLTAAATWPFGEAVIYSWLGALSACTVGFVTARYLAKDYAEKFLPEAYHQFNRQLARNAFTVVVLTRLTFGLTTVAHVGLAISGISFRTNILASAATLIWPISIITFFGDVFFSWASQQNMTTWIVIGGLVAALLALRFYAQQKRRRELRRRQAKTPVTIDMTAVREDSAAGKITQSDAA